MDDLKYLEKLQYEQDRVLQDNKDAQGVREKIKEDYLKLQAKLQNLPNTISEDAMVPIGSVGFFPGHLVHTNEIMVLLGDNWFIERSAKESIEIIERRVKMVDEQLSDLQKEHDIIKAQYDYTDAFRKQNQDCGDIKEIKEELSGEDLPKKGKSRKAHKPKHDLVPRSVKFKDMDDLVDNIQADSLQNNSDTTIDHDELYARLNELEREEQEEEERLHAQQMQSLLDGKYNAVFNRHESYSDDDAAKTTERHVKFKNDSKDSAVRRRSYESDGEQESSNNIIKFTHTMRQQMERSASESDLTRDINSPADIFKRFASKLSHNVDEKPLKSILKKDSRSNSSENLRLKPILKTSPEHQLGASESSLDDPIPILKTPPDSQGSDRRPGTPEYTLSDDRKSILKVNNMHPYSITASDFDNMEPRPILKSPEMQLDVTMENITENMRDETKSILKTQGEINSFGCDVSAVDSCGGVSMEENRKTILKPQELSQSCKVRNEVAERKPILKNPITEAVSEEVFERKDHATGKKDPAKSKSNTRPISKFKASRSKR